MKTHIVLQVKRQLQNKLNRHVSFELHGNKWDLSVMRISYKLTKRTNKPEKFKKILKTNNIISFKVFHYELTALSDFFHSITLN